MKMNQQNTTELERTLNQTEQEQLEQQNQRLVPKFRAEKFQKETQKHWDLFYKRNTTKFFKDRHWTIREFQDLADLSKNNHHQGQTFVLEAGCGVGNFIFPLLEECKSNWFAYACDFSPRAVEMVKSHPGYDETKIKGFQCDITKPEDLKANLDGNEIDVISLVFVLSAIRPKLFARVLENLFDILKIGGRVIFRDYALNDMTMIRFKPGTKVSERLYLRQDGTTSYFFTKEEFGQIVEKAGFKVVKIEYIHRQTVNKKENIDVPRIFLQAVLQKTEPNKD